eukprot:scaffold12975_cov34-Tisochrysis_lutea.AAC.2
MQRLLPDLMGCTVRTPGASHRLVLASLEVLRMRREQRVSSREAASEGVATDEVPCSYMDPRAIRRNIRCEGSRYMRNQGARRRGTPPCAQVSLVGSVRVFGAEQGRFPAS